MLTGIFIGALAGLITHIIYNRVTLVPQQQPYTYYTLTDPDTFETFEVVVDLTDLKT